MPEKLSLVLASMERALVTSERQRLLAERKIQDLTAELQTAQSTASSEARSRPPSALRSPALRHKSPELKADSRPPDLWEGRGENVERDTKSLVEALGAREKERDLARAQLHTALTLLERQSQLKAAISSIASTSEAGIDGPGDRAEETAAESRSGFGTTEDVNAEPAAEKSTEGGANGGVGAARDDRQSRTTDGSAMPLCVDYEPLFYAMACCPIFPLFSLLFFLAWSPNRAFTMSCVVPCADLFLLLSPAACQQRGKASLKRCDWEAWSPVSGGPSSQSCRCLTPLVFRFIYLCVFCAPLHVVLSFIFSGIPNSQSCRCAKQVSIRLFAVRMRLATVDRPAKSGHARMHAHTLPQ